MPRLGVITGTHREAACFRPARRGDRFDIACSGADSGRALELAENQLSDGCTALLSFGVAGGLDPSLAPGTLVLADAVIGPDGVKSPTDRPWREAVAAALTVAGIGFVTGAAAGADEAITEPQSKRLLFEATGALCVDTESHAVMRAARDGAVPFLALRAVADGASDVLPDMALAAVDSGGTVRGGALAAQLCRRPAGVIELFGLWRMSRPAFAGLGRVAALACLRGPL